MAPSSASLSLRSTSGCAVSSARTALRRVPVPLAVDDPHLGQAGQRCFVDELPHLLACLVCGPAADVDLVGDVAARRGAHLHRRDALLGRALARRAQARDRDAHALAGRADHLGLVAAQRGDRAAHADVGRLDVVADRERAGHRQRPGEIGQRAVDARRALGRRAERTIDVGLAALAPCASRSSSRSDGELGARVGKLALRRGDRVPPLLIRRRTHALELALELGLAPRGTARRLLGRRELLAGDACGGLGLGEQLRRAQALGRDARARVGDDRRRRARAARRCAARATHLDGRDRSGRAAGRCRGRSRSRRSRHRRARSPTPSARRSAS